MAEKQIIILKEVFENGLIQFRKYDRGKENLLKNTISFSDRKIFNDPFDCNLPIELCTEGEWQNFFLTLDEVLSPASITQRARELAFDPIKAKGDIESLIYDHRRFTCFSTASDKNLFGNNMFWASYADKHTGLCLKFDGEKLISNFKRKGIDVIPVNYNKSDSIPPFNYIRNRLAGSPENASKYFFGMKSKEWINEDEIRFVYFSKTKFDKNQNFLEVEFNPLCLKEVYLGCRLNPNKIDEVKQILSNSKYEHVKIFKLELDQKHFKLNPIEVKR